MKIRAVVFDLDGTLCDTITDITSSVNHALLKHDLSLISVEECRSFLGHGSKVLIRKAIGKEDKALFDSVFATYYEDYTTNPVVFTKAYEGMYDLLTKLKKSGLKVAVLTNKPHDLAVAILNQVFPNFAFDLIIGQKEGIEPKPDLGGFDKLIEELNVTYEEVMYVGDSKVDIETGTKAKCQMTVAVTYGYVDESELVKENPPYIVHSVKELQELALCSKVVKKYPDLMLDILSLVGYGVPVVLSALIAFYFDNTYIKEAGQITLYTSLGIGFVYYLINIVRRKTFNRPSYIFLVSTLLATDLFILLYEEIQNQAEGLGLDGIIFLASGLFFALLALITLVAYITKIVYFHKCARKLENLQKSRQDLLK